MSRTHNEIRKFKMHPDLLFSVIKSQAGTIEKAILEGVMNTVDAGATNCKIFIDSDGFKIIDDGKGFASKSEIDLFFETFGTPHKDGDATYGRFRMGRGQLFAFASTVWKSNTFEMHVDIKEQGLDYLFKENMPYVNGCIIEGKWYSKLSLQDCFLVKKEIEHLTKYMQIPVYLDDKKINIDIEQQKWDYKEKDFYIKINKNSSVLSVYNMGSLVTNYSASKLGVGGVIVSTCALQVNFARNDILVNSCKVWKKIVAKTNEILGKEVSKKTILNESERNALLNKLLSQEIYINDVFTKGLLVDVSNRKVNFKTLINTINLSFSAGNHQTKMEEKINDSKTCLVLHRDMLDQFNVSSTEMFVKRIQELIDINNEHYKSLYSQYEQTKEYRKMMEYYSQILKIKFTPNIFKIEELIKDLNSQHNICDVKKLNKKEMIFLKSIKYINPYIANLVCSKINTNKTKDYQDFKKFQRDIYLGESQLSKGWTNGNSYIAVNKNMISFSPFEIIHLLVHEYCHNFTTLESHDHDIEFYQLFHDVIDNGVIGHAMYQFQKFRNSEYLKNNIKPLKNYDINLDIQSQYYSLEDNNKN